MHMSAYCFFDVLAIKDPVKMEIYRSRVFQTVEAYGGRYVVIGGKLDVVEGTWQPVYPVIIEFPSLEQAHRWYNSEEYRELKALRLESTDCHAVFIEGL